MYGCLHTYMFRSEVNEHTNCVSASCKHASFPYGNLTKTIQNANMMSLLGLSQRWKELVGKAKAKQLKPDEYSGGTFTITNLGMYGT